MKTNFLRKTAAGVMALAMLCSAAACSNNASDSGESGSSASKSSGKVKEPQTADQVVQNSYKAVELEGSLELDYVEKMSPVGDTGKVLIAGGDNSDGSVLYLTDTDFADFTKVELELENNRSKQSYFRTAIAPDGTIYALVTVVDYGDFELPDDNDPDFDYENFDYEAMYAAATYSYKLCVIGIDGKIVSETEITGLEDFTDEDGGTPYLGDVYSGGDQGVIVMLSGMEEKYVVVGFDGKIQKEIELDENTGFYSACTDSNGNLAFLTWGEDSEVIKTIDTQKMELTSDELKLADLEDLRNANVLISGTNGYNYYLSGTAGLYGVNADGSAEQLINWMDSDMNGDYISGIIALPDGDFVVFERNWSTGGSTFYRLTKRDVSELSNTIVVTMAMMWPDSDVTEVINKFNKSNDQYRIRIEDYSKYSEYDDEKEEVINTPAKQLKMDLISGKSPDMIYCYDNSILNALASKGTFVDLYDYLGKDGSVSKDELMPNLLAACEYDGKLVSLAPSFYVSTMAAKTKYCDKENWTLDDLIETYNNLPDGMKLFEDGNSRDNIFYNLITAYSFVDYKNGTCNFDSPEFVKILEFANRFDENDGIDWETATDDEMQQYWNERENAILNDKALLGYISFGEREYARARYGNFGEDITFVGYPSPDGNGGSMSVNNYFSILSDSANKDVCWDFISQFFTDEYQTSDRIYSNPALISAFESKMDKQMERPYYTDDNGKKVEYDDVTYIGEKEIKIPVLTQEERDRVSNYVKSVKTVDNLYANEEISNIVSEEAQAYFNGERSAQEAADLIQNRCSIIISEQS